MSTSPLRTGPQRSTEDALLDGALAHLRERGVDGLTIRSVAERVGCSHTTGYAYFSSLDHLVAALFWRQVRRSSGDDESGLGTDGASGDERDGGAAAASREVESGVVWALTAPASAAATDPALARAAQRALLSDEAAVSAVRDTLGGYVAARLVRALDPATPTPVIDDLLVAYSGAMLQASLGYLPFDEVPRRVASLARRLLG